MVRPAVSEESLTPFDKIQANVRRGQGDAIRKWREQKLGWTREHLAAELRRFGTKSSVSTIGRWERGQIALRVDELALLEALKPGIAASLKKVLSSVAKRASLSPSAAAQWHASGSRLH